LWQEGIRRFWRGRVAVFLTALRNSGSRTLNKFTAGSNALNVCQFHKIYSHSCQGYGDSSIVAIISKGGVVLSIAMLKDAVAGRLSEEPDNRYPASTTTPSQ
jgi:hypothetical protein